jgi:hypothetical protein
VSAAPWVAAYATALLLWLIVLVTGRQPTLWKGRTLVYLNGAVVLAILLVMLARRQAPDWGLWVLGGVLLVSAIAVRNAWLLLHVDRTDIDKILEKCFAQTRASHNRTPAGYSVTAGGDEMTIAITPMLAGHAVCFGGSTSSKKAQLICALIAKQFRPSIPAFRIRT